MITSYLNGRYYGDEEEARKKQIVTGNSVRMAPANWKPPVSWREAGLPWREGYPSQGERGAPASKKINALNRTSGRRQ